MAAQWPAGLDRWLLHCPLSHPFWPWCVVSVISLRDVPGMKPAVITTPGATHEVMIFALDPDFHPDDRWCTGGAGRWNARTLTPANLVEQLVGLTDEHANELVFLFAHSCCDGLTSPDSDYRAQNVRLLQGTADHLRQGRHIPS